MAIPQNITKEHLLKAIEKIDLEGIPKDGDSQYYDVIYQGKKYPPKLVVSYANIFANGTELDRNTFSGGTKTPCFKLLKKNQFMIQERQTIGYYKELMKFIEVSNTQTKGLGTTPDAKNFKQTTLQKYQDLKVDISFGIGRATAIPWISFLYYGQTTSNGIYPVYLYYIEKKLLILAYGISITNVPKTIWDIKEPLTIENYFKNNNLGKVPNYGNSYVYKIYDLNKNYTETEINSDLNQIINTYKTILDNTLLNLPIEHGQMNKPKEFKVQEFINDLSKSGLTFSNPLVHRFISSICSKPFIICSGLSGSGKTKLAQAFAMWICENDKQYCIVPVGADWSNREPLLGFPNVLLVNDYKKDEYGVLNLIIEANKNIDKPYFLILDEMNLSHVERYFADFLSVMESKGKISLHSGKENWNNVPSEIGFPKNLFIIGTVNIDETTYMFSPKVLDRANVIEFRVTEEEMANYLKNNSAINLKNLEGLGATIASSFVKIAMNDTLKVKDADIAELNKSLMSFFSELKKTGAEFGYRSASEILRFAAVLNKIDPTWTMTEIIDAAIMQKLLPKVHGSRRKLEPVLKSLGQVCLQDTQKFDDFLLMKTEINFKDTNKIKYPISLEKLLRMYDNLISNGFTSYAEA